LEGRPQIETELRLLIRRMIVENPLWGAPRIHGELLKLGFEVTQSSVAKYMVKRRAPPSQGWRTFLHNHAPDIAAMDLFVVPTIGFDLLYAFIIVRLDRRELVWISVTTHPTAEWVVRQIIQAFPWDEAPRYLIRDRDRIYGTVITRRLRAMGIRDKPCTSLAVAEWLCRAVDRIDPARVLVLPVCAERAKKTSLIRHSTLLERAPPSESELCSVSEVQARRCGVFRPQSSEYRDCRFRR
jgi:hypothetical protein